MSMHVYALKYFLPLCSSTVVFIYIYECKKFYLRMAFCDNVGLEIVIFVINFYSLTAGLGKTLVTVS
jgi:hypothetical protein